MPPWSHPCANIHVYQSWVFPLLFDAPSIHQKSSQDSDGASSQKRDVLPSGTPSTCPAQDANSLLHMPTIVCKKKNGCRWAGAWWSISKVNWSSCSRSLPCGWASWRTCPSYHIWRGIYMVIKKMIHIIKRPGHILYSTQQRARERKPVLPISVEGYAAPVHTSISTATQLHKAWSSWHSGETHQCWEESFSKVETASFLAFFDSLNSKL